MREAASLRFSRDSILSITAFIRATGSPVVGEGREVFLVPEDVRDVFLEEVRDFFLEDEESPLIATTAMIMTATARTPPPIA